MEEVSTQVQCLVGTFFIFQGNTCPVEGRRSTELLHLALLLSWSSCQQAEVSFGYGCYGNTTSISRRQDGGEIFEQLSRHSFGAWDELSPGILPGSLDDPNCNRRLQPSFFIAMIFGRLVVWNGERRK